jgi:hypothetical protein
VLFDEDINIGHGLREKIGFGWKRSHVCLIGEEDCGEDSGSSRGDNVVLSVFDPMLGLDRKRERLVKGGGSCCSFLGVFLGFFFLDFLLFFTSLDFVYIIRYCESTNLELIDYRTKESEIMNLIVWRFCNFNTAKAFPLLFSY